MNLHGERNLIVSIVNIQGKDPAGIREFNRHGTPWAVASLLALAHTLPADAIVRGVPSASHPSKARAGFDPHRASCLYDLTFRTLGMARIRDARGNLLHYQGPIGDAKDNGSSQQLI